MKDFKINPPLRTITCKCDACCDLLRYDHGKKITAMFDTVSQMVVCDRCQYDFEISAKVWETPVMWAPVPESRICYDEREYEPDYDND